VSVNCVGEVEQGGGDMDQNQGKRWREQGIATARGDEGCGLGLNPNRTHLYTPTQGTGPGQAAVPGRVGHGRPQVGLSGPCRPGRRAKSGGPCHAMVQASEA
jgi:hypothetical protein